MLHPRTRNITLDVKHLFALIAVVCFLISLLKFTGWIFGHGNEQSFLVGGFLALSISWLYSDAPRARSGMAPQPQPQPQPPLDPTDPKSHIGMR